jgi:quercetin dioxygenase-like cupin family protein
VTGDRLQLLHQRVRAGTAIPRHRHANEQMTVVLSGRLRAVVEETDIVVGPGEVLVVRADVEHMTEVLADAVVLEVFAPPRPELA